MADEQTLICPGSALAEGGKGVRFEIHANGRVRSCFVVRYAAAVHAFVNECPHAFSELDWQPGEFFDSSGLYLICATHGAVFLPESGHCVGGPCKDRRLISLPVQERDGNVYLTEGFTVHGK